MKSEESKKAELVLADLVELNHAAGGEFKEIKSESEPNSGAWLFSRERSEGRQLTTP